MSERVAVRGGTLFARVDGSEALSQGDAPGEGDAPPGPYDFYQVSLTMTDRPTGAVRWT